MYIENQSDNNFFQIFLLLPTNYIIFAEIKHCYMKRLLTLIAFLISLSVDILLATVPRISNYSKAIYNGGAQNYAIAQTSSGCIYFGNHTGLLEFDGADWNQYYVTNGTNVRSLCWVADNQRLYAGAFDEFGYFTAGEDGLMRFTSLKNAFEESSRESMMFEFIDIDHLGDYIFFRTDWNIFRYNQATGEGKVFAIDDDRINSSAVIYDTFFFSTAASGPMIMSSDMLIPILGRGADLLTNKHISEFVGWHSGSIIFLTTKGGLYLYDGSTIERLTTSCDSILLNDHATCAALAGSTLAVGTVSSGLLLIDLQRGTHSNINARNGLQNNRILSLMFDDDDNLWVGLDNGIDHIKLSLPDYALVARSNYYGTGYDSVLYDDRLYIGTNQGLYSTPFDGDLDGVQHFEPVTRSVTKVWSLSVLEGALFCCHEDGLSVNYRGDRYDIRGVDGAWRVVPIAGEHNRLLCCGYKGLFVLHRKAGRWALSHRVDGLEESSAMFVEDSDGSWWYSHWQKGLFRLTFDADFSYVQTMTHYGKQQGLPEDYNNVPYLLDGSIVFSSGSGFFLFDREIDRMVPNSQLNVLFSNRKPSSIRIHPLRKRGVLFVSENFIGMGYRNRQNEITIDSTSLSHLTKELIIGFESVRMLDDNTVILSSEYGFSVIDMERLEQGSERQNDHGVFIKSIHSTKPYKRLLYGERTAPTQEVTMPEIAARNNCISIEVALPEFRDTNSVEYSFMLDGYDSSWSNFSTVNSKEYTGLKGGKYTLRVKARNRLSGKESSTSLRFSVAPPYWATPIAFFVYALASAALLCAFIMWLNRRSNRKLLDIQRQKEEELRNQQLYNEQLAKEHEKEIILLQKQALEHNLRNKSDELASSTHNLIRKNEILMSVDNSIGKVAATLHSGDVAKASIQLKRLQKEIRENIAHDSDWEKFANNFDTVYDDYLKRLGAAFPKLNLNDQRLCAYLRMDLQTKDIAPLMNISVRSVEMARYRLRRKMGLSRDVNLSDFLQKF